jgi:hypothetical protein
VGARSGSFFAEILMSDVFFVIFELRDRYGDVGHHLLVQDALSFIQKYMSLINFWSIFAFVYISYKRMFFIDFHVLALPGSSRSHRVSASKKINTDSPDFGFSYYNLMQFIYGQRFFSQKTDNSCPQSILGNNRSHTLFLTNDSLREFPHVQLS